MVAGNYQVSDTTNREKVSEMKKEAEEKKLHRMAMVHDCLEMWQGSQNLRFTQNESHSQNKQMTAVGYISDTEVIVKTSWWLLQPHGAAEFQLSEWSSLPPPLSAKNLSGGQTYILCVHPIWWFNCHRVNTDEDRAPESISDTENWLNWNRDLENPNDCEDDCAADNESNIEHNNGIDDPECPEQLHVSAAPNVPGLVWPTRKSKRQAPKVLVMVNAIEMRRNKGVKKM